MFKKDNFYGQILLFLYENPSSRCYKVSIIKHLIKGDIFEVGEVRLTYINEVIEWLLIDGLIVSEENEMFSATLYRISYRGYSFIKDLKEKRSSRIINTVSILIACISILVSSTISTCNNKNSTKVEITKFPSPVKK